MDRLKEALISMGIDSKSIPEPSNFNTESEGVRLKDADTAAIAGDDGEFALRFQGINAAETGKFMPDKGIIKGDQPGAQLQTELVAQTIKEGGYTQPVLSGDKGFYNRELGDLSNPQGQRLTNELLYKGYVDLGEGATQDQRAYEAYGNIDRRERALELKPTVADEMFDRLVGEQYPGGRAMAKLYTTDAKDFNQADTDFFVGPGVVQQGEDERGVSTAFFAGWPGGIDRTYQGLWGSMEMIGDTIGSQWLKDLGTQNVRMYQSNIEANPYLANPEAFDENGEWQLDTLGKVFSYAVDQASSSAPQMLASIVAFMAAPMTYGLSMAIPSAIYTGQTWNDQSPENKNAGAALVSGVTQATLDSLPISRIFKPGMDITKKATQDLVKSELVSQLKVQPWVAEQMLTNHLKKEISKVSRVIKDTTIKQVTGTKAIARDTIEGVVAESVTESLQELAGYLGENVTLSLPSDPEELNKLKNRLANAATGGAILGGGLSGASTAYSTATRRLGTSEISSDAEFREKFKRENNVTDVPTVASLQSDAQKSVATDENTLSNLASMEESKRGTEGITSKIGSWWTDKGLSTVFGKRAVMIMKGAQYSGKYMAALGTLLGANKAVNGRSIDEHQQLLEANIFSSFGTKEELLGKFKGLDEKAINQMFLSSAVRDNMQRLFLEMDKNPGITAEQIATSLGLNFGNHNNHKDALVEYSSRIRKLVSNYNNATGTKLTAKEFLNRSPLNKSTVSRNYKQFKKDLQNIFGVNEKESSDIVDSILNNNNVTTMEDPFDELLNIGKTNYKDKDTLLSKMNDPENRAKFSKYLSNDILDNAYTLASKGAAISTNVNLIGKNGERMAALINAALKDKSIDEETASFMAKEIKDFIDTREGKYHKINNVFVNGALSTLNFLSTIVALPLAAFSSTVEFAQVYRNLNKEQSLKATRILLLGTVKELGALMRDIGHGVTSKVDIKNVKHRDDLSRAGFIREGNMSHRLDVMSGFYQKWTEGFFKITGLTSVTTITRNARRGIATDAIHNWINTLKDVDPSYPMEQDQIDARDHLIRIGIDVDFMTGDMRPTETDRARFESNMQQGVFNFINEAVVVPSALNRPKFYSDPYLRLFTQFQGYTSTFTATLLPRLIKDLGKKGSDDQKNAASVIALMFALSLLALAMKDMIKYGESPPEWLEDDKKFQRIVGQMGILGTGQRIWDTMDPLFDSQYRNEGVAGKLWQNISEQSPQLSYLNKLNTAISAPEGKGIQRAARVLPIIGTSPSFAELLQKELGDL